MRDHHGTSSGRLLAAAVERSGGSKDQAAQQIHQHCGVSLLRAHRTACGYTLTDVTELLKQVLRERGTPAEGLAHQMVSRWESGADLPSPHYFDALCFLYRTRPDRLGFGHDYSNAERPPRPRAGRAPGAARRGERLPALHRDAGRVRARTHGGHGRHPEAPAARPDLGPPAPALPDAGEERGLHRRPPDRRRERPRDVPLVRRRPGRHPPRAGRRRRGVDRRPPLRRPGSADAARRWTPSAGPSASSTPCRRRRRRPTASTSPSTFLRWHQSNALSIVGEARLADPLRRRALELPGSRGGLVGRSLLLLDEASLLFPAGDLDRASGLVREAWDGVPAAYHVGQIPGRTTTVLRALPAARASSPQVTELTEYRGSLTAAAPVA